MNQQQNQRKQILKKDKKNKNDEKNIDIDIHSTYKITTT